MCLSSVHTDRRLSNVAFENMISGKNKLLFSVDEESVSWMLKMNMFVYQCNNNASYHGQNEELLMHESNCDTYLYTLYSKYWQFFIFFVCFERSLFCFKHF